MQFALVEDVVSDPLPGLKGSCRCCGTPTVAKCGQHNIWHWAHKSLVSCDPWWETETEWHRNWKNKFPREWHECIHFDPGTGEKHVADVKTDCGLVIEFQHSAMKPDELKSREQFYKNMVWIIDGCRGELDLANFRISRGGQIHDNPVAHSLNWWGRSKLFDNWIQATKPVFVDFGENILWRLVLYNCTSRKGVIGPIKQDSLVENLTQGRVLEEWPISDVLKNSVADATLLNNQRNESRQLSLF